MAAKLVALVREAAAGARAIARAYPEGCSAAALPWAVVERFDADVRGHVERDPRIEDGRDQVLIAAVTLAEAGVEEEDVPERERLVKAINDLEWVTLSRGIANRAAAALGYGEAGVRLRDAG
ncbi:hypothetical protein QR79_19505 [Methylobacterium indicum]|uniref:NTP pyrophosphohydrolase MazG putative catalytic core domain-containing protein n=1 Tax=Methylobacterium indicum TaxID=1775910 RepID=A0ABR5H7A7_9HYPH|nr:hypothetical protein [Methylobacterium indicum]KMO19633.1 hypothetical protein QR79_19505 [Methylobacterium indicum]